MGEELITLEIELHRFVLPEFNTHRVFSRNFQSSRAVPVEKMIEQVRTQPAMPVHWGKNQRGMVAEEECDNLVGVYGFYGPQGEWHDEYTVEETWRLAASQAAGLAYDLDKAGYHKQIVNRLLEPFMWTKGVVTATRGGFESFFKLRCHPDAQPEIKLLAEIMREAIRRSEPDYLDVGEYHLPYVGWQKVANGKYTVEEAVKISTSCAAQVSYRVLDESLDKALKIYGMLNLPVNGVYPEDPPHYSPTEHVAKVVQGYEHEQFMGGNFVTGEFWQYRKALEKGTEQEFMA